MVICGYMSFDSVKNFIVEKPFFSVVFALVVGFSFGAGSAYAKSKNEIVEAAPEITGPVTVDLSGAVKNPGVYTLDSSARVGDAVRLGGGFLSEASEMWVSKSLNLSQPLEDSEKIYIPFEWEVTEVVPVAVIPFPGSAISNTLASSTSTASAKDTTSQAENTSSSGALINVNTGPNSDLETLKGVGPSYADRIVANRPYKDIIEFRELSGIPSSTVDNIESSISF